MGCRESVELTSARRALLFTVGAGAHAFVARRLRRRCFGCGSAAMRMRSRRAGFPSVSPEGRPGRMT